MVKVISKLKSISFLFCIACLQIPIVMPAAYAAVDTSSCDGMAASTLVEKILKTTCYFQLAKQSKDGSICKAAPLPVGCVGYLAAELERPEIIARNLDGEARDLAMSVYAVTIDPHTLDSVQDNRVHDFTVINLVTALFVSGQLDDKVGLAMPREWCNSKLRGNYEGFKGYNEAHQSLADEFSANKNVCNELIAQTRELAYDDDSCDNWYASVYEGLESLDDMNEAHRVAYEQSPELMKELSTRANVIAACKEGVEELKSQLKKAGITEIIQNSEQEAQQKMAADDPSSARAARAKLIDDCPQCASYRDWLSENAKTCGYHGDRLPSICEKDPECVEWNKECARQHALLEECLEACRLAAVPEGPGLSDENNCRPHEIWLDENADGCGYHGARLPSVCANDPVCLKWNEECGRQHEFLKTCRAKRRAECIHQRQQLAEKSPERHAQGIIGWTYSWAHGTALGGDVEIDLCTGGRVPMKKEIPIRVGDCIRTGKDGFIVIDLKDPKPDSENPIEGQARIRSNTEICFDGYEAEPTDFEATVNLIKGTIRSMTSGWRAPDIFTIKAGVTLCHVRDADVAVSNDPSKETTYAYVNHGHINLTSSREAKTQELAAGEKLVVKRGVIGPVQPLPSHEWEELTADDGLDVQEDRGKQAGAVLPDFTGKPLREARQWLQDNQLTVRLKPGSAASSAELSGAVEAQEPMAGQTLKEGEQVLLTVHSAFVDVREVPNVLGMKLADAKALLSGQGLEPVLRPGKPAPTATKSGTIESQQPAGGTTVEKGAAVTLVVHSAYVDERTMPDVSGLAAQRARSRIVESGLKPVMRPAGAAPSSGEAGKVSQTDPEPGTLLAADAEVEVFVYGPHVEESLPPRVDPVVTPPKSEKIADLIIGSEWRLSRKGTDGASEARHRMHRLKFVKDGNRIIGQAQEAFFYTLCARLCYEITGTIDDSTFSARRYASDGKTDAVTLKFSILDQYSDGTVVLGLQETPTFYDWRWNYIIPEDGRKTSAGTQSDRSQKPASDGKQAVGASPDTGANSTGNIGCEWVENPIGLFGEGESDEKNWVCSCPDEPEADRWRCGR